MISRIRDLRKSAKMTQDEISEKSGVALRTYQDIEYGNTENPGIHLIAPIAKTLNVSIDYLVYGETKDTKKAQLHVLIDRLSDKDVTLLLELAEDRIRRNQTKNSSTG